MSGPLDLNNVFDPFVNGQEDFINGQQPDDSEFNQSERITYMIGYEQERQDMIEAGKMWRISSMK